MEIKSVGRFDIKLNNNRLISQLKYGDLSNFEHWFAGRTRFRTYRLIEIDLPDSLNVVAPKRKRNPLISQILRFYFH